MSKPNETVQRPDSRLLRCCRTRPVRAVLIAAFLGLLTTVLVAWGIALFVGEFREGSHVEFLRIDYDHSPLDAASLWGRFERANGVGVTRYELSSSPLVLYFRDPVHRSIAERSQDHALNVLRSSVPDWVAPPPPGKITGSTASVSLGYGFPFRCLSLSYHVEYDYRVYSVFPAITNKIGMLTLDDPLDRGRSWERLSLPYNPIWSGLLANSLAYGFVWLMVFTAIGFARRAVRRGRGRCTRCNYDLSGAVTPVCPECGRAVGATAKMG